MSFLIKHCQIMNHDDCVDIRLNGDRITDIAPTLAKQANETVLDAAGGLLLPGLQDHHIHLVSLAASLASVSCGPPDIDNEQQLSALLKQENEHDNETWLRGIGYHTSVAGDIDRHWLDRCIPDRPARVQHRGGRLWILNSKALESLHLLSDQPQASLPEGMEFKGEQPSGRFYECDQWLRARMGSSFPCLAKASQLLASYGVTGITDTTPHNGANEQAFFLKSQIEGKLLQKARMMGGATLPEQSVSPALQAGEYKVHLLESQLPDFDALLDEITQAHNRHRNVAIHCVTRTELVFALTCLETAGVLAGDRVEHASVTPPEQLDKIAALGLRVVSQPHFIHERGEQYLRDVEADDQPWLYRLRSFIEAGVPLGAGSDAPFGTPNPWLAMQAAVSRCTVEGTPMSEQESLTPEMALGLYMSEANRPGLEQRHIAIGGEASLCLLDTPWAKIRTRLTDASVVTTWVEGKLVYKRNNT